MRNNRNNASPEKSSSAPIVALFLVLAGVVAALFLFDGTLRRLSESRMARVTSPHYEILTPRETLSAAAMEQFAAQHEKVFAVLNARLENAASNTKIRVILDPAYSSARDLAASEQPYTVSGTTVRTKLIAHDPSLPAAADAEALLFAAWGMPGNDRIARWTAIWLTGEWRGSDIGMAAAEAEQKLGYKKLEVVLGDSPVQIPQGNQDLLGAAWISEIYDFGGEDAVRKLYAARMRRPNIAEVTRALGTSPLELERKWQMWSYAYLAGMPAMSHGSTMPMNMPMAGSH